ncbi:MAG TPA: hypothetical protein QF857_03040, partial [Gammaproteobacteria bacterium]|nr:hypothetical protein [Gammaproteobacteria bacterium]
TFSNLNTDTQISIDITDHIYTTGEHSFALGVSAQSDKVSFYSKEKLITDGISLPGDGEGILSDDGNGSGYAPQIEVWPSLSF